MGPVGNSYRVSTSGALTVFDSNESIIVDIRECDDVVGNYPHINPLTIDRRSITQIEYANGRLQTHPVAFNHVEKMIPSYYRPIVVAHNPVDTTPDAATTLVARSNPSRPTVQLPVTILELRELPDLIRHIGRHLTITGLPKGRWGRNLAESNLAWQFGWAPLFKDLRKLNQFQDHVNQRVKEINKLHSGTGLRRRLTLSDGVSKSSDNSVTVHSTNCTIRCKMESTTSWKRWGTVRWTPDAPIPTTEGAVEAQALKAILGLSLDYGNIASSTWEAIPWSWLIDWFANVGEYLQTHNNSVPASPSGISICETVNTTKTFTRTTGDSWVRGGGATLSRVTKTRRLGSATLAASLPFLDNRQVSILGSLAVLRSTRFHG